MGQIRWSTDCNAPCPGMIVNAEKPDQNILVQTDWDYPGVASSFGWSTRDVQKCRGCRADLPATDSIDTDDEPVKCDECGKKKFGKKGQNVECDHDGTDGTVACPACGVQPTEFIEAAADFLRDNDGATADDPGYF